MNKINKLLFLAAGISLLFTSCYESYDKRTPSPLDDESLQNVRFEGISETYLIEADDPYEVVIKVYRDRTDDAVTKDVTFTALEAGQRDVFINVPSTVSFAQGENETEFRFECPDATLGMSYSLRLVIEDAELKEYTSGSDILDLAVVTDVDWQPIGRGVFVENMFGAIFGTDAYPYYVDIESGEAFDGEVRYRFYAFNFTEIESEIEPDVNGIYEGWAYYEEASEYNAAMQDYLVIRVPENGEVVMDTYVPPVDWGIDIYVRSWIITGYPDDPAGIWDSAANAIIFPNATLGMTWIGEGSADLGENRIYLTVEDYLASLEED